MSYLYASNLDSLDRRSQLEIQLDNGTSAILRKGHFYELSSTELARARQYIVLTSSATPADEEPIGLVYLPVKGNPTAGQVPVWDVNEGAFVPGDAPTGGGGGGGGTADKGVVIHGSTASTARPSGYGSVEWIGSVEPTNAANNDTWVPTA
jgi:hypothetical protein